MTKIPHGEPAATVCQVCGMCYRRKRPTDSHVQKAQGTRRLHRDKQLHMCVWTYLQHLRKLALPCPPLPLGSSSNSCPTADAPMTPAQGRGAGSSGAAKRPSAEDLSKQQNHPPEIYNIVKARAKLESSRRARGGPQPGQKTLCASCSGKPNRLKETMLAQEEAYMKKGSEARASESFRETRGRHGGSAVTRQLYNATSCRAFHFSH